MGSVKELIGSHIINKDKNRVDAGTVFGPGKYFGLYFSAHWCPPCRGFTPLLAEWYNKFRTTDAGQNFSIIFVSSDRDDASFEGYFAEMPWLALEYQNRDAKEKLASMCSINGIPTLVILDGETGAIITNEAEQYVAEDPEGSRFPWS